MPTHSDITAYTLDILWAGIIFYWVVRAFSNKKTIYRQSRGRRLANLLIFAGVVAAISIVPFTHHRFFDETPVTEAIGIVITVLGIALAVHARNVLGKNWSGNPTLKQNHELITGGPYRFVRHPIYTGLVLALAGTMFATRPSIGGISYVVLLAVSFGFKLRFEESLMLKQFPDAYPEYRRRVTTAFIPWVY